MPRRKTKHGNAVSGSAEWCHICGLPIPPRTMSTHHALFMTVDHVLPLSLKGADTLRNRRAAHSLCNRQKSNLKLSQMGKDCRDRLAVVVLAALREFDGESVPKRVRALAALRRLEVDAGESIYYAVPEKYVSPNAATVAFLDQ